MKINYIYILLEPTGEVRYVGKSVNPEDRYRKHLNEARKRKIITYKNNWIYSLLNKGLKPKMEIIDQIDGKWEWLEQYWISQMKAWGFDLVNNTEGGENPPAWKGGQSHSDEFIKSLSDRMKKDNPSKNMNDKWKSKISNSLKGKTPCNIDMIIKKREVLQFNLKGEFIKEFESMLDAANSVGLKNTSGIRSVCNGERFKSGGYRWAYKDVGLVKYNNKPRNNRAVLQFEGGKLINEWSSISDAAESVGAKDSSAIRNACIGKTNSSFGFIWKFK